MPTIDSTSANIESQLIKVLEDIARNVEIHNDFSIHHPSYKPLEIPATAIARFQQMPQHITQKFLSSQLCSFLYGIYYNGSMQSSLALNGDRQILSLDLENNTITGINISFFQQLHDANCGQGYFDSGWHVLRIEDDRTLVVKKGLLRLYVNRQQHLLEPERQAQVGDTVSIKMPKNRMQNGFYLAVGDRGFSNPTAADVLVRIYVNLTPDGSVSVMKSLTEALNRAGISFSFKVLYNPHEYHRYDSGVLYFNDRDYPVVASVLGSIYPEHRSHFLPEIPLFTKQLAIGVGVAEEPNQKFGDRESFGMNRCQMIANGLMESFDRGNNSSSDRMSTILEQFSIAGVSLKYPYLNHDSEDIYYPLG